MRAPLPPGSPVNGPRRGQWLGRFQGYRVATGADEVDAWLAQFEAADQDVAARVLDAVEFVTQHEMEEALRQALRGLPGWHQDAAQRRGKWRFVAFGPPGSSGDRMLHQFKVANGLDWDTYNELFIHKSELLLQALGPDDTVVFVDDFAGSGRQVCTAWESNLQELLATGPKAYLVLVAASSAAIERITQDTKLEPRAQRVFVGGDNLFSAECPYFSADEKGTLLEYCTLADKKQPRGYGDCGLLVVLAHRCPNNSLPILHARNAKFRGLFPRN